MIVYSGTKKTFQRDVVNGIVASKLDSLFVELGITRESAAEFKSWKESLPRMGLIIADQRIDDDVQVALEYQIPLTSKRIDFMIGGSDGQKDHVVIVELKQWEDCEATQRENVVKAFTGGAIRAVAHPSQQAYSYAKLIENFNEDVRINDIGLIPCAYLHNFKEKTDRTFVTQNIRKLFLMHRYSSRKTVMLCQSLLRSVYPSLQRRIYLTSLKTEH
jgi:hypothetical protein